MTLIILLIGLALETFYGVFVKYRQFGWLIQLYYWLEKRLSRYRFWDGVPGVLLTLACPLLVVLVVDYGLGELLVVLSFLFTIIVLVYSLGPDNLDELLKKYIDAREAGDMAQAEMVAAEVIGEEVSDKEGQEQKLLGAILVREHQRIFAVMFWFVILGAFGALLYRLVCELGESLSEIAGGYTEAIRDLHQILSWPSSRLLAIGFALSGSLVHTFEKWNEINEVSLEASDAVVRECGLGAIQYSSAVPADENLDEAGYWIREIQGLINRTVIMWLTVLAIITLAGWLA